MKQNLIIAITFSAMMSSCEMQNDNSQLSYAADIFTHCNGGEDKIEVLNSSLDSVTTGQEGETYVYFSCKLKYKQNCRLYWSSDFPYAYAGDVLELSNCVVEFKKSQSTTNCSTVSGITSNKSFKFVASNGQILNRKQYELRCYELQKQEMEAAGWNYENHIKNLEAEND